MRRIFCNNTKFQLKNCVLRIAIVYRFHACFVDSTGNWKQRNGNSYCLIDCSTMLAILSTLIKFSCCSYFEHHSMTIQRIWTAVLNILCLLIQGECRYHFGFKEYSYSGMPIFKIFLCFFHLKSIFFVLEIFTYLDVSNHSIYQLWVFTLASNLFLHLQVILLIFLLHTIYVVQLRAAILYFFLACVAFTVWMDAIVYVFLWFWSENKSSRLCLRVFIFRRYCWKSCQMLLFYFWF